MRQTLNRRGGVLVYTKTCSSALISLIMITWKSKKIANKCLQPSIALNLLYYRYTNYQYEKAKMVGLKFVVLFGKASLGEGVNQANLSCNIRDDSFDLSLDLCRGQVSNLTR